MEKSKVLYESEIFTGSEMNLRTFGDDESWNSLQSTILAGHVSTDNSSVFSEENLNELTYTVNEENSMLLKEVMRDDLGDDSFKSAIDENILNINLDALSEDDVFVGSSALYPRQPVRSTLRIDIPSSPNDIQVSSTQVSANEYLHIFDFDSLPNNLTEKEKTGALLVQAINDYNDIKYHAQSTLIKDSSKSKCTASPIGISLESLKNPSNNVKDRNRANTSNVSRSKSTSDLPHTSNSNLKRAYLLVNQRSTMHSKSPKKTPKKQTKASSIMSRRSLEFVSSPVKPVKELRKLFSPSTASTRAMGIRYPTYRVKEKYKRKYRKKQTQENQINKRNFPKVSKSGDLKLCSAVNKVPKTNEMQSKIPFSSCSEFSKDSLFNTQSYKDSLDSKSSRSKSTSDLPHTSIYTIAEWSSMTYKIKKALKRVYLLVNQRSTMHSKSPKKTPKNQIKASSIMSRRSMEFVSSPVKPVKELRKLFSPSVRAMENQINKRNLPKVSKKSKVPRIIVDGDLKL